MLGPAPLEPLFKGVELSFIIPFLIIPLPVITIVELFSKPGLVRVIVQEVHIVTVCLKVASLALSVESPPKILVKALATFSTLS